MDGGLVYRDQPPDRNDQITLVELINHGWKYDLEQKKAGKEKENRRIPMTDRVFTIQILVFGNGI